MNIDITSFFFNSNIEGATATAAWGTSIGQSKKKECRIESDIIGVTDLLTGMIYKSKTDKGNFDLKDGSSSREYLLYSIFDKVYVNNKLIDGKSFIVLLSRESSKSHEGRLNISYPPYAKYDFENVHISNKDTIDAMRESLDCRAEGCWFGYDISVVNQDELHFSCIVVDKEKFMTYKGTSSQRSKEWLSLLPTDKRNVYDRNICGGNSIHKRATTAPLQQIYFGAPGTGKSYAVNKEVNKDVGGKDNPNAIRTTFHPDSDYSTFVGCYKPIQKEESDEITYKFCPQAFTKAYVEAWLNPGEQYYLVIEEINRGNCAQIFGDIFQLLDRNASGESDYAISPDNDLQKYLSEEFDKCDIADDDIKSGKKMKLSSNLSIYATMNTSDQSLFPIDSAFKRRWDWKYIPINKDEEGHYIECGNEHYDWWDFLEKVNPKIDSTTGSEDKQLGFWFAKPENDKGKISAEKFVSKVVFYLWNDVFKDYTTDGNNVFKTDNGLLTFRQFFDKNGDISLDILSKFLLGLNVSKIESETTTEELLQ